MPSRLETRLALLGLLALEACGQPGTRPAATGAIAVRFLGDLANIPAPQWHSDVLFTTLAHDSVPLGRFVDARFGHDSTLITNQESNLLVFGPDGRLLRLLGRDGDGPGEYRRIFRLGLSPDGTLLVSDFATGRVTQLSSKGVRVIAYLGRLSPTYEIEPLTMLASDQILATFWQRRPNRDESGLRSGPFERDSAPLLVFDSGGALEATLGVWPGLERARVHLDGELARLPPPFARSVLTQGRGSWVAITVTDSLDLSLYEDTTVVLRLTGTPMTAAPTPELQRMWEHTLPVEFPDVAESYRRAIHGAPQVPRLPAVGGLGLDGSGNLWIGGTAMPDDTIRNWTIIGRNGQVRGHLRLPSTGSYALPGHRELLDVDGDRLALLRETLDGEPFIEVRRVYP